jgi:hypothetical protein
MKGSESAKFEGMEESQMGNLIQNPEVAFADCVPAEEQVEFSPISTEYRDAVTCLHDIIELSPRTAHRIMRNIIGVRRNLVTIADGELE